MYNFLSRRVQIDLEDMHRYAFIDFDQKYTRNLISTDNELYTLLLLCWSPGQASPIHDHPCDGCWMRVVHGQVCESRYKEVKHDSFSSDDDSSSTYWNTTISPLKCTHSETYTQGQVAFIRFHRFSQNIQSHFGAYRVSAFVLSTFRGMSHVVGTSYESIANNCWLLFCLRPSAFGIAQGLVLLKFPSWRRLFDHLMESYAIRPFRH